MGRVRRRSSGGGGKEESDTSSLADENEEVSNISSGSRDNHDFTRKQSREKKARERKNGTDSSSIVSLSSSSLATAARSLKKRLKKGFWFRQKRTYGPPYHEDYGGDLIEECNKFFASAKEVHEMLCNGADPNIENESEHGLTALHYAARYGNIGILEMLVEAGGDVNHATPMGLTPLAAACMFPLEVLKTDAKLKQRQLDTIQWLLDRGVTVDVVDKGGFTPLTWACRSGLKEAVVSLVEAGADVMQRRPALPKGSQVCIPKVDVLSPVTVDDEIRAYIMEKIDEILAREEEERFNRKRDETAQKMKQKVHGDIMERQEKRRLHAARLSAANSEARLQFEFLRLDRAEAARRLRQGVHASRSPFESGVWEISPESDECRQGRPLWKFMESKIANEDGLQADIEYQAHILRESLSSDLRAKVAAPRWEALTGDRLA